MSMRWHDFTKRQPKGGVWVWAWMPGWGYADILQTYTRPDKQIGFVDPNEPSCAVDVTGVTHWQGITRPKPPSEFSPIQKAKQSEN